jgi:hypothetical protein
MNASLGDYLHHAFQALGLGRLPLRSVCLLKLLAHQGPCAPFAEILWA